ncbi:Fur family transcriptional regulator [Streptococcus cuniculipharyngis]|uniref:Transcriptional repressor n=1 Tax=Streptococcus cuniculipharyngis TaxID=1562651 RepID=A0A5C5SC97_9STRE|nr:Fur family transcriptional regulator [Streptococcus cuniculipharyngis]TWS96910.1 transcriptional repressor [Streptococcus cuniculipharyngis]
MEFNLSESEQALYQETLAEFKERQIRLTDTRKAIIAYMIESHDHPSAEMIYQDLLPAYPSMSLATVYNNLKVLVDEGFVSELKLPQDSTSYYDFLGHQHPHVICQVCGKIVDVMVAASLPDLKTAIETETGFHVTKTQTMIYGICPDCQEKKD